VTASLDGTAAVWSLVETTSPARRFDLGEPILNVALDTRGTLAVVATRAGSIHRLDTRLGRIERAFATGPITAADITPDGSQLFTGDAQGRIRAWRLSDGTPGTLAIAMTSAVSALRVSPDGQAILVGDRRGQVRLWGSGDGRPLSPALDRGSAVEAVDLLDARGPLLSVGGRLARVWRLGGTEPSCQTLDQYPPLLYSGVMHPDGQAVLLGGVRNRARLFELATSHAVGDPLLHRGSVRALAFQRDGKRLVSGGDDRAARLWDPVSGVPLGPPLDTPGHIRAVAIEPSGAWFLAGDDEGTVIQQPIPAPRPGPPEAIVRDLEAMTGMRLRVMGARAGVLEALSPAAWRQVRPLPAEAGPGGAGSGR
jgi:WD40 repeat protein